MRLINAGFGRTGTTSLKAALEELGYGPVFHSTHLIQSKDGLDYWEAAVRWEDVDWAEFFKGYDVADWPTGLFYREIISAHPDAKVMITVRDPEGWYKSIHGQLSKLMKIHLPFKKFKRFKALMKEYAFEKLFEGNFDDQSHMIQFFETYTQSVIDFVGEENLLVYDVRQGWEPLCEFLGEPVPDKPFPRLNTQESIKDILASVFRPN